MCQRLTQPWQAESFPRCFVRRYAGGAPCGRTRLRRILSTMSDMADRLNAALEGRYTIERELGEGGMATVYLADDIKHERKVALKVRKREENR